MFGDQIKPANPVQGQPDYAKCSANAGAPSEFGVRSAIAELVDQVKSIAAQCQELRSVLGISIPESAGPGAEGADSLVGTISILAGIVHSSNLHLNDCLRHLRT